MQKFAGLAYVCLLTVNDVYNDYKVLSSLKLLKYFSPRWQEKLFFNDNVQIP